MKATVLNKNSKIFQSNLWMLTSERISLKWNFGKIFNNDDVPPKRISSARENNILQNFHQFHAFECVVPRNIDAVKY